MPLGPQPKHARGTIGHPYSALNLRLLLASLGLVICLVLAAVLVRMGFAVTAVVLAGLAVLAAVNLTVVQTRRRRAEPRRYSRFE